MRQTDHVRARDAAISWLAVLILSLAIFAVLWGIARLLAGAEISWYDRFSVGVMLLWIDLTVISVLLVAAFFGWSLLRNRSR